MNEPAWDIADRVVVVTGGNRGVGKAVATELVRRGARVIIVSRDEKNGAEAVRDIARETERDHIELVTGSLNTVEDAHRLAGDLTTRYPAIHVLINNAGVWMSRRTLTDDGIESTFMVNHLGPFILSLRLLPLLRQSAPSRIVNINAGLYIFGKVDLERTPAGLDFSPFRTYADSKLANLLFTVELSRRLEGAGVTVNAVHPGVFRTSLGDSRRFLGAITKVLKLFLKSPEQGAGPSVRLAADPRLSSKTGGFFLCYEEKKIRPIARDEDLAVRLWNLSVRLGEITESPPGVE